MINKLELEKLQKEVSTLIMSQREMLKTIEIMLDRLEKLEKSVK